jgi:large subunit ribosomal protein L19
MKKVMEYNQKVRASRKMPELRSGNIVKVHRKVKEGGKERTQVFEGIIISIKGKQSSSPMITVRKVSFGVGVEITVPVFSPLVEKIEVVKKAKTRQAKLYYLRRKDFKLSKLKMKELDQFVAEEEKTEAVSEENADELDEGKEKITKDEITEKKEVKKD